MRYFTKLFSLLLIIGSFFPLARAQTTVVTATITDPNGQVFANGAVTANYLRPFGGSSITPTVNGVPITELGTAAMNSSGTFTITLADLSKVVPTGGVWAFTICPQASSQCQVINSQSVVGSAINLTLFFAAYIVPISVAPNTTLSMSYLDAEVVKAPAQIWLDVTLQQLKYIDGTGTIHALAAGTSLSLTTTGSSGPATLNAGVLNIPQYTGGSSISLTTTGSSGPATLTGGVLNIPQYTGTSYITSLTTTGSSGAATVVSGVLNIPQYTGSSLTLTTTGTSGAATYSGGTLNIPQYTGTVASITTTGTSGPATLLSGVLNIPQYSGTSYITSLTTTGSSGAASVTSGVLNIPQYTGGGGSGTVNSGTQYSPTYYAATGTAVAGVTPFTGLEYFSGSAAPAAATSTQVQGVIGSGVYDASGLSATETTRAEAAESTLTTNVAGLYHTVSFTFAGSPIVTGTGSLGTNPVPGISAWSGTIINCKLVANQSGSMSIQVWKANAAIPTSANNISASAPMTLTSTQNNTTCPLTGWTTSVAVNDEFLASVVSTDGALTTATLILYFH